MRKPARAEDWDCRQSCFTWLTFSFRIADVRKVGLSSELLTRKSIAKRKKETAGRPGLYIIDSTFNTISLLVPVLKLKCWYCQKLSRLSRSETHGEGRGKRGKKAVSTNVCDFIQIYSMYKVRYWKGRGRGRERRKEKERKSARKCREKKGRRKRKTR